MNQINQLEKEKEMLLLRLRLIEEKNPVLDQVSSTLEQDSLASLSYTELEIQVSSNQLLQASLDASLGKMSDQYGQPSTTQINCGTDEPTQQGYPYWSRLNESLDFSNETLGEKLDKDNQASEPQELSSELKEEEDYLTLPEEDEQEEVLEVGDRVVELLSGIKGVVVGFKDDRVVFDCAELGRCSRRAILLKKI